MMRLALLSDLHVETHRPGTWAAREDGVDVWVLAGDIHHKGMGVAWAQDTFSKPVIYVPGNHEGYKAHWEKMLNKMREQAQGSHVHLLHHDVLVLDGVRFLGTTLWTRFDAWPDLSQAMHEASLGREVYSGHGMKDYRYIRTGAAYRRITPHDTRAWAGQDRQFLLQEGTKPHDGPTVVVTHHPPVLGALEGPVREPIDAAYVNDWEDGVRALGADLWCHGHTHHPCSLQVGRTIITSSPWGYPDEDLGTPWGVWEVGQGQAASFHPLSSLLNYTPDRPKPGRIGRRVG